MAVYLTNKQAAERLNIGENTLRDILNSRDHPPYLLFGNSKKVRLSAWVEYFKGKEIP